jgi:hypothetical protein
MLAIAALATALPAADASAADRELTVAPATQVARAGAAVTVTARATEASSCTLTLATPRGARLRSTTATPRTAVMTWRWTVPHATPASSWTGSIACAAAPSTSGARERAVAVRVTGGGSGPLRLADARGVAVTVLAEPAEAPKWTETGGFWIALAGLLITSLGLFGVYLQLATARKQGRSDRTAQLFERYQTEHFTGVMSRTVRGFLAASSVEECFERVRVWDQAVHAGSELVLDRWSRRPPANVSDVNYLVNFHEEIGVLFNTETISRTQVLRHFGSMIVEVFEIAWWWVHWQRENRLRAVVAGHPLPYESEHYAEWQRMVEAIIATRRDLRPATRPVWIVCRPGDGADRAEWRRYKEVSIALTRAAERLDALERLLPAYPGGAVDNARRLSGHVLCIPSWQEGFHEQLRIQRVAGGLARLLESKGVHELGAVARSALGSE